MRDAPPMPQINLRAADGHELSAYRIDPEGTPRGAIVIAQEIFGINAHMRAVAARFAGQGYVAIAPALFDRTERGVELGYDEAGFARGKELAAKTTPDGLLADMQAAIDAVADAIPEPGKVGTVGYCFGGAVVWVAAAKLEGSCAVSYYGSRIAQFKDLKPRVPVMMHVGKNDASFPVEQVREIAGAHPGVQAHEYDAGHGFNCDHRADFAPDAAAVALQRTLGFLTEHVG